MPIQENKTDPGMLNSILHNKCPRCRQGDMFITKNPYNLKMTMQMPDACEVCSQKFELQPGFYFGTGYLSYGIAVFISVVTFLVWWLTIGISVSDNRIFWWLGVNAAILILLQPPIQRLSRAAWIAFFVRYDKDWAVGVQQ